MGSTESREAPRHGQPEEKCWRGTGGCCWGRGVGGGAGRPAWPLAVKGGRRWADDRWAGGSGLRDVLGGRIWRDGDGPVTNAFGDGQLGRCSEEDAEARRNGGCGRPFGLWERPAMFGEARTACSDGRRGGDGRRSDLAGGVTWPGGDARIWCAGCGSTGGGTGGFGWRQPGGGTAVMPTVGCTEEARRRRGAEVDGSVEGSRGLSVERVWV